MLTARLLDTARQLDAAVERLAAAVPLIRDDLPADQRAAVNAAHVLDAVALELLAFVRSGCPDRLRELADHVTEWLADNVGYTTA